MNNLKSIEELQGIVSRAIEEVDLPLEPSELYKPIRYLLSIGGKHLRPVLVLMTADMYQLDLTKVMPQAIGVELFHNFTLMHDDIMDEAPIRRGKPTVHEKWNTNVAILSGDVLFVKSYQLIVKTESRFLNKILALFNKTATEVCEGQQLDMNFETQVDVSMSSYLKMIRFKTAVLLACSLKIGAIVADASNEDQENLYHFGIHIGIAFQLMDDILDVYGDQKDFGKQVAGDIVSNKKTCLYVTAFEKANKDQRKVLDYYFSHQDFEPKQKVLEVMKVYDAIGVKASCLEMMAENHALAIGYLNAVSVTKVRKSVLFKFIEILMFRVN